MESIQLVLPTDFELRFREEDGNLSFHDVLKDAFRALDPKEAFTPLEESSHSLWALTLAQRLWPDLETLGSSALTPGAEAALALSLKPILNPGQTLLTTEPVFPDYPLLAESEVRLRALPFPLDAEALETWRSTVQELAPTQSRILIWMSEPDGAGRLMSQQDRLAWLDCLEHHLPPGSALIFDTRWVDYVSSPMDMRRALDAYAQWAISSRFYFGAVLSMEASHTLWGLPSGALVFPWVCRGEALAFPRPMFPLPSMPYRLLSLINREGKLMTDLLQAHRDWTDRLAVRYRELRESLKLQNGQLLDWKGGCCAALQTENPQSLFFQLQSLKLPFQRSGKWIQLSLGSMGKRAIY